jgi:hypothetical protein
MKTGNKRFTALLCAVLILVGLTGCGKTPIDKVQDRAVEIGEQFLDGELTKAEAREKLGSLMVPETEGTGQITLEGDIRYLHFVIGKNDSTYEDVKYEIDHIAARNYND